MLSWNTWHLVNISYFHSYCQYTNEDNFLWPIAFAPHLSDWLLTGLEYIRWRTLGWWGNLLGGRLCNVSLDLEVEWGRTLSRENLDRAGTRRSGSFAPGGNILIHLHLYFKKSTYIIYYYFNPQYIFFVSVTSCIKLNCLHITLKWNSVMFIVIINIFNASWDAGCISGDPDFEWSDSFLYSLLHRPRDLK